MDGTRGMGSEKVGPLMEAKNENQNILAREIKIVPTWLWVLAVGVVATSTTLFSIFLPHQKDAPPQWACPLIGLAAGMAIGVYVLFVGYVNRDAKRRGMSPLLWTLVVIFIPNALGFILYFVLRQPMRTACPQCGTLVQPGFSFCPHCSYKLNPTCPHCQHSLRLSDQFCPYCGTSLQNAGVK